MQDTISNLGRPRARRLRRDVRVLAEHLTRDPRFAGSEVDDLVALVRAGTVVSVPAHWVFLQEGTPADSLYVLLAGHAEVFSERRAIADVGPGDIVGEIALLQRSERTATVTSSEPVKALRVDYRRLATVLARHPALRQVILGGGAGRVRTVA